MVSTSIIIPTYNGAHKIGNVLKALENQINKDFQVIVVIDGSTDQTQTLLENTQFQLPSIQVIVQPNGGRSVARNTGVRVADGTLLLFFDDDMRPVPESVSLHQQHHVKHPNSIMVGSQIEEMQVLSSDIQRYKGELTRRWEAPLAQSKGQMRKTNLFLTAGNFSISKTDFLRLGGFDERLTDAEDFDLAVKAYKAGIPIYFNPEAIGWHDDFITWPSYIKRQRQYTLAHKRLIALNPWMAAEGFINLPVAPTGVKEQMFKFFSNHVWLKLASSKAILLLPKKVRYKMYDLIITSNGIYYPDNVGL